MLSEKPKNKRKNSEQQSKTQLIFLAAAIIILIAFASVFMMMPSLFPTEIKISDVQSVHIQYRWSGLSPIAPIQADYDLRMQEDGTLTGTATYKITYDELTETVDIVIPADVVEAFNNKLSTIDLERETYTPLIEWTDDYPSLSIIVETKTAVYKVYSGSQGENHVPWGATVDNEEFTVNSAIPAEALIILEPHLKLNVQEAMIDAYRQ